MKVLHTNLVNSYINGYTDKLSLAKDIVNGNVKNIALDKAHF